MPKIEKKKKIRKIIFEEINLSANIFILFSHNIKMIHVLKVAQHTNSRHLIELSY